MKAQKVVQPQSYIICTTPRSGSTLLCDLLHDTRVAGNPHSFFRRQDFVEWAKYFKVPAADWRDNQSFDRSYLEAVLRYGTGGTPVFGMRLMWESLDNLSRRLEIFFPGLPSDSARFQAVFRLPIYVYLSRDDKIAQAVSRWKVEQTGLWHINVDGSERERIKPGQTPTYDAQKISELVENLEEDDAAWVRWFTQQGIVPVRVTYEMLSSEPQTTISMILSALGQDRSVAKTVKPKTAKLADIQSREWAARFRAERHSPKT